MNHSLDLSAHISRARPISLTALIDVVFILLMFFMLTSSFSQWQMLNLKQPKANEESTKDMPPIVLVYEEDLALLTDVIIKPITLQKIKHVLTKTDGVHSLVISAEESVSVNRLIEQYEQLKTLGFKRIQIGGVVSKKTQAISQ